MAMTKAESAWRERGFRDGYRDWKYQAAAASRMGGEKAELWYSEGFRIGRRERLREQGAASPSATSRGTAGLGRASRAMAGRGKAMQPTQRSPHGSNNNT